ncbi:zinc ribbon domain-containing protein [Lactiplantibacillus daowaiensis]|uniref:Zinc ribbon domain-containing protein n=1 Tax=Lactiplantibacillus daowaiensis TaxID=2559918 RepID=A0ABW1RWA7_9LACO|nr:zinc ribbon domain-containing protein [Lactiplantibacillus daowaiensis]
MLQHYDQAADDHQSGGFCPNCGQPVAIGDEFCGHCGFNLKAQSTTNQSTPQSSQSTTPQSTRVQRQSSRLPQWAWVTIGIVVVALIGGYLFGRNYYSRTNQLNRDITALKTGKTGVYKQFTTSDPSLKLSAQTIKPLLKRFKTNPQALATFQSQLQTGSMTTDGLFEYEATGKAWLFFDKYQIKVKPVYATLTTNRQGAQLNVNGKRVATSQSTSYSHKFGPYVPGNYTLMAVGTVNGQLLKNTGTVYLHENNATYNLDLRTISFTVSGTPKTKVYLNQHYQGTIGSTGNLAIKDAAWSSNLLLTGKYVVGKKTITSNATKITSADADQTVSVAFPGTMSKSTASDYFNNLFTAISGYTDDGDLADATDDDDNTLDSYFVDGTSNADYQGFAKMAKGYYDNDDVLSVTYTPTVLAVAPATKSQSQVTYDVKYEFENSKDSRIQVFRYTATLEKNGSNMQIVKITPAQKIRAYTSTNDDDD